MQLNRQNRIREADTDDTRLGDYSDIVQGSAGFVPPAIKAQQAGSELHTSPEFGAAPVVQLPVGYVVHSTQSTNGLGPGEKQALAGGFFVMFSLAIAVAIGWWITPATPPSFTANDAPARASAGRDEAGRAIYGHAAINPATTNGDREATGEISPPPTPAPAAPPSTASATAPAAPVPALVQSRQSEAAEESTSSASKASTSGMSTAERNEEIQRLKAQAYSETRADRLGAAPAPKSPPTPKPSKSSSSASRPAAKPARVDLSEAVAECRNEVGIFFQERCKWRLCNGRWGKQGCPSYDHEPHASRQAGILNGNGEQPAPHKKTRQISLSRFSVFS